MAIINIEIPAFLGKLVDAVTSHLMTAGSNASKEVLSEFLEKLKEPATKLVLLYLAQVLRYTINSNYESRKGTLI